MKKLVWLHLSDIHFLPNNEWQDSTVRTALLDFLNEQIAEHKLQVDLIFCTGDVAFGELKTQTLAQQYAMARAFFDQVLEVCQCDKTRLFVVPGNHDIDRNCISLAMQESWTRWGSSQAQEKVDVIPVGFARLDHETKEVMRRLEAWGAFVADYLPHQAIAASGHHHYAQTITIEDCSIGIAGFNSAWTCAGDNDDRTLWLAANPQFNHMREKLESADIKIGLIHHPWDWFNVAEQNIIRRRIKEDAHFWLHGHTHHTWIEPQSTHVTLGAGAVTAGSETEFGINLVQLNFDTNQGQAHLYRYQKQRAKWIIDNTDDSNGIRSFELPSSLKGDGSDTPPNYPKNAQPTLRGSSPLPARPRCLFREKELANLAEAALALTPQPVLLHGLGGMGKTEIVTAFLCTAQAQQRFGTARFFLSVEQLENTLPADLPERLYAILARTLLQLPEPQATAITADYLYQALHQALVQYARPVLLVLDNYETLLQIDQALASTTIDTLAAFAHQGLALVVTLRNPLPHPSSACVNLAIAAFSDHQEASSVLLKWANLELAQLTADEKAALKRLVTLAEGYPIQLQMLGTLAHDEGLVALAGRCSSELALATITDQHEQNDPHRHPNLSFAITWNAPRLSAAAKSLLRAIALIPNGVDSTWLALWPQAEAVRCLRSFKLLFPFTGSRGEERQRLLAPFRLYVFRHHPLLDEDKAATLTGWYTWWYQQAPELFDTQLPRKEATWYRDLHACELPSVAALRPTGIMSNGKLGNKLGLALNLLTKLCGGVSDWVQQATKIRQTVLNSDLFSSVEGALSFASLLVGSQSLTPAIKNDVAEAFRQNKLKRRQVNDLRETFEREMTSLAWLFNSFDLISQVSDLLGTGLVCLHAPVEQMLLEIEQCPDLAVRLVLLHLALTEQHLNPEERDRVVAVLAALRTSMQEHALAHVMRVSSDAHLRLAQLERALKLDPNYGHAWRSLAELLPNDSPAAKHAWQQALLCAERHHAEAALRKLPKAPLACRFQFDATLFLHGQQAALPVLREWVMAIGEVRNFKESFLLLSRFSDLQAWDGVKQEFLYCAECCKTEQEMRQMWRFAVKIQHHYPYDFFSALRTLYTTLEHEDCLVQAAFLLLALGLPHLAGDYLSLVNTSTLSAADQNNLAYVLLTKADDVAKTLKLARQLAKAAFTKEASPHHAQTLLCAALRAPRDILDSDKSAALQHLLDMDAQAPDVSQLAGLYFDAKRYNALALLRTDMDACTAATQNLSTWQALDALLRDATPTDEPSLHCTLLEHLETIQSTLTEQTTWREQHAEDSIKVERKAKDWVSEISQVKLTKGE